LGAVSAFAILLAVASYGTETGRIAMNAYGEAIVDQGAILTGAGAPGRLAVR
jgi:hypothetical protein